MTGWSRQRADSKLSTWAKNQDLATVERELERAEKDVRRAGSVSLNPEYIFKRQQERARARDATNRLSSIGLRVDLGPFLFDQPIAHPGSNPKIAAKQPPPGEQREILTLKNELARLKDRETELEFALAASENKRDEERKLFDRDRKLMMSTIAKLKLEVTNGWSRITRLRQKYEGASLRAESELGSSSNIYQTDESFERIFRPSTGRGFLERTEQPAINAATRPSSAALNRPSTQSDSHRTPSLRKSSDHGPKPLTAVSPLKNPSEGSRSRRTSIG